jgi:heme exporter protein B
VNRFSLLLAHDLKLALRQSSDGLTVLTFFLLAVSLFPLGIGP